MNKKIDGEISADLKESIIKSLPKLNAIHSTDHSILINVMGGQTRSFFRNLQQKKEVEVLWTDWIGKSWWSYIFSFIPGQAGLIKILDRTHLDILIKEIADMSYCGIYYIPNKKVEAVLMEVKSKRNNDISKFFENEKNYFLLDIDFDYHGGEKDGEIFYRQLFIGDNLNPEIKDVLMRTEQIEALIDNNLL